MAYSNIVLQPALHVWTCLYVYTVKYTFPWNQDLAINAPQVIPQISSFVIPVNYFRLYISAHSVILLNIAQLQNTVTSMVFQDYQYQSNEKTRHLKLIYFAFLNLINCQLPVMQLHVKHAKTVSSPEFISIHSMDGMKAKLLKKI